jgi:SAM-dependent methyltransferase
LNYNKKNATTDDIHLRSLEIITLIDLLHHIKPELRKKILDIGCGDGVSTISLAHSFPDSVFTGIDYSETMIKIANQNLMKDKSLEERIHFFVGDVTKLDASIDQEKYDIIISDRCLINLGSSDVQFNSIRMISEHVIDGGYFIAIENFNEGQISMNQARKLMGLPEIPIRWHNHYFCESDFLNYAKKIFSQVSIKNFASSYYFATRVIYSAMCQMHGEKPNYNHEIHQLAVKLPWTGNFSPIKLAVMKK